MMQSESGRHIKLWVHTPQVDGYPPEEWETLWAVPVGDDLVRIDNIPFYAKGLSMDDIVKGKVGISGERVFEKLVKASKNSTIRVILFEISREPELRKRLEGYGCSVEGVGISGMIAVNVPEMSKERCLKLLESAFAAKWLDFEEGVLR